MGSLVGSSYNCHGKYKEVDQHQKLSWGVKKMRPTSGRCAIYNQTNRGYMHRARFFLVEETSEGLTPSGWFSAGNQNWNTPYKPSPVGFPLREFASGSFQIPERSFPTDKGETNIGRCAIYFQPAGGPLVGDNLICPVVFLSI